MCFSAEASFASGVVLSTIGAATMKKVEKPSQMLFAAVPLFFGVQQISEGFLWISLSNPEYAIVQKTSMYIFLLMARVIWPMLIPLAALLMEEDKKKKRIILGFLMMGLSVSLYYTYCLLFLNVAPQIMGHHIQYISDFSESLATPVFVIYFVASLTPLFLSSVKRTSLLGALFLISGVATVILYTEYLTSVWCFFAAVISMGIYWIVKRNDK